MRRPNLARSLQWTAQRLRIAELADLLIWRLLVRTFEELASGGLCIVLVAISCYLGT